MQEYTVGSIKKVDYSLIGLKTAGKEMRLGDQPGNFYKPVI